MSIKGRAYIVGAFEHPTRKADDRSVAQIHADVAKGALDDAGLHPKDIDAYYCSCDSAALKPWNLIEYMGLANVRHIDGTDSGGSSYLLHVSHAAQAIAAGKANIALVTLAGRPRAEGQAVGTAPRQVPEAGPDTWWELPYAPTIVNMYAMAAKRHMYEFGTTSEQLAWIKVAASHHAQHNPHAMLRDVVTVADVVNSPMVADPLHRLDSCVVSDGGGAVIVAAPEVAKSLKRPRVKLLGAGEAFKGQIGGRNLDLTYTAAAWSGPQAFAEAGVKPSDIQYASIYDSFTITVLMQIEDLGFCKKGEGGRFVSDGNLIAGRGRLPFNTDGGGLCNNHPSNRGGMTKIIETVRQLRGEAHPAVQVKGCNLALAQGIGGSIGTRHVSATLVMERE